MKKLFKILLILCAVLPYTAGAGEVQINLKGWTTDGVMTTQFLTVQDCEDSAGSGNFTLNGMCAVDQSGLPATWLWWGTDAFLDSWNGYASNANGNGIYWAWFGNRELGATALNTHILSPNEELLLTYGPNPLRLNVDDTSPDVGQAISIFVEEFGYDINWNAVWSPSDGAAVSVTGNLGGLTDASGIYSFTSSDGNAFSVQAVKNSFADSNEVTVDPNDPPPPPPPPPPPSGGGSVVLIQTPPPPKNFDLTAAINFILSRQKPDGSFGDSLYTDWVAVALGATETGEHAEAKEHLRSYLKEYSLSTDVQLTDYERGAMALMSLGMNPYEGSGHDYIAEIVKSFDGEQFGDPNLFNDDIFAILALTNAGYGANDSMLQSVARFLLSKQSVQGDFNGVDLTAAFIQALEPLSSLPDIAFSLDRAKNYLRGRQESNGGLSSIFGTSWALQTSAISRESGLRYLALFQLSDGGLQDAGLAPDGRLWATSYAVPAVLGKNWNEILLDFTKPVTQTLEFFEAEAMPSKEFSRSSSRSVSAPASGVETKLAQPDAQKFSDGPALTITAVASSTDPMDSKESVWLATYSVLSVAGLVLLRRLIFKL